MYCIFGCNFTTNTSKTTVKNTVCYAVHRKGK